MIYRRFFSLTVLLFFFTASDPYFGVELTHTQAPELNTDVREMQWMSTSAFKPYLTDYDNRVDDAFSITPYYYPNVHFWFLIYTQFESSSVVIHDKNNLSLIYKVLDYSSLHKKQLPKNTIYVLQQKISQEKINELKQDYTELIERPESLTPKAKKIHFMLRNAGIRIPSQPVARKELFLNLRDSIRSQTGQKNFIRDGVVRSLPYQRFLANYFEAKKLPKELLAIPFLESSFNPKAHSKVNALGAWQFMPLIASYFLPKRTKQYDYRSNIGLSSLAGGFLMAENYKIMKSWDLAVTAYNSGTKHLLKTKRELASQDVKLKDVIENSDSRHFGFASKNFYSEFLALVHTLAYEEELFDDIHSEDRDDVNQDLLFYMAKCSLRIKSTLSPEQMSDVLFHNHQLPNSNFLLPRGFILTTKSKLPETKFYKVPVNEILKTRPKDWDKLIRRQSCSTR